MNNCPCCSSTLLRHIRHSQVYWYCPHCHEEMPNFDKYSIAQAILTQEQLSVTPKKMSSHQRDSTPAWLGLASELAAV
ncbi:MAG: hypothetical protein SWJ54_11000 [Cyanobacteriota bacterium]|nr:hypothetical protein [Cyanobacteriota bacterium]